MKQLPAVSIQLFGVPQIIQLGVPVTGLRRKNRALLYFVAAHKHPVARENVLGLFWPDHPRSAAQQVFRTVLYELRKGIGEALVINRETLSIANIVTVDALVFEAAITGHSAADVKQREALRHALESYCGDFLAGFALADTPEFDDWVASERERYRLVAVRGYVALAQHQAQDQNHVGAIRSIEAALKLDPLQEELHRTMMQLRYQNRDRVGAIRQFELLRRLLDDELGVAPMPETRTLYDEIIQDRRAFISNNVIEVVTPKSPTPDSTQRAFDQRRLPFTGRANEWKRLQQACQQGKLALIEGEPGIGKTRLAEEFIGRTATLVLRGTAHELNQNVPYQPLTDALRTLATRQDWPMMRDTLQLAPIWLNEAARIVPELVAEPTGIPTTIANESHLWESVTQLLYALAQQYRVTFILDDLHWADGATLGFLGYLMRSAGFAGLSVVCTTRFAGSSSKLAALLHALTREDKLTRIVPPPFSLDEITVLVGASGAASSTWLPQWLADRSEGNPFFVTELLRFAKEHQWLQADMPSDMLSTPGASIPETIRHLIVSRIAQMSKPARHVLDLAAVIGREFGLDLIVQASQLDEISVIEACDELRSAALIKTGREYEYRFDHSLTLEVVQHEMDIPRSRALHRRVAEALEALNRGHTDLVVGTVAQHYLLAQATQHAAPFAFRAAALAAGIAAWNESIALYEQVLAIGLREWQVPALIGLSESHFHQGNVQMALQLVQSALASAHLATTDAAMLDKLYDLLLRTHIPSGRYAEVIEYAKVLRRDGSAELALCAEYVIGTALNVEGAHLVEAEQHLLEAERLLNLPRSFSSCITLAKLYFQRANVLGQQGNIRAAITMLTDVLRMVQQDESVLDLQLHILLYNSLAHYQHQLGDPTASEHARTGLRIAQEKGSLTHQSYLLSTAGEIALAQGDLDAAEGYFTEGLVRARQLNARERIAGLHANLGRVALHRGQQAPARAYLTEALTLADQLGAQFLATRIRMWLIPILPLHESQIAVRKALQTAKQNGYDTLLAEIAELLPQFGQSVLET